MSKLRTNEIESLDGQSLASVKDLSSINKRTRYISNIAESLNGMVGSDGARYAVNEWHPGSRAGGHILVFDALEPKTNHGTTGWSPTVPPVSAQTGTTLSERVDNFLNGVGETDPTGSGLFVFSEKDSTVFDVTKRGAIGNANFRDNSTGLWYQDEGLTTPAYDSTPNFMSAFYAGGGNDKRSTIYFPGGNFLISPEDVDTDGIDIRLKTLQGAGIFSTRVAQSGHNTYQTLFRNGPRNLSEAGVWGSGGTFNVYDMSLRGNWDGASGQTATTPPSGNGNGLVGIMPVDYDFDAQGGVLQLISSTRSNLDRISVSHGYGHNIKYYRNGYGFVGNGRTYATRGSGIWALAPGSSSAWTSAPISNMKFETCRGGYGGLNIIHMWGNSITDCLFEGQPYGIYMGESGDVDTSGNYMEGHYTEDFYIDPTCWGITDVANYAFGQDERVSPFKGLFHYRRDSGLFVDTDNLTYGSRDANVNGNYLQRNARGLNVKPAPYGNEGGVADHIRRQLAAGSGAGSLGSYTAIRHDHDDTGAGAAEIRFLRNLSNDSRSGLSFATTSDGVNVVERWELNSSGDLLPSSDNTVDIGSASKRVVQIFAILPTAADEAAAVSAGLSTGQMYKTSTGEIRIKL